MSQRLQERAERVRNLRAKANRNADSRARMLDTARERWQAGYVVPDRITMFLDMRGLYGPEVDKAVGVEEPTVDQWEAGEVYPTWEQLVALAELCDVSPIVFTDGWGEASRGWKIPSWWRSHFKIQTDAEWEQFAAPPIERFNRAALAEHRERTSRGDGKETR